MKTYQARNTTAAVKKLAHTGKLYVTFPAGTAGRHFRKVLMRKVTPTFRRDGTVTVRAFRGEWTLKASVVSHPECRKDNGRPFRAYVSLTPEFVRWVS